MQKGWGVEGSSINTFLAGLRGRVEGGTEKEAEINSVFLTGRKAWGENSKDKKKCILDISHFPPLVSRLESVFDS